MSMWGTLLGVRNETNIKERTTTIDNINVSSADIAAILLLCLEDLKDRRSESV
jgi:hypothetical protein